MVRRLASLLLILLTVFAVIPAYSEDGADHALTEMAKKVSMFTLDNGLRVVFYRRGIAPVFSGYVGVRVGGVDEAVGTTGKSHMLEHMAFKGTSTIGTKDYSREKVLLQELEAIMGHASPDHPLLPEELATVEAINKELNTLWEPSKLTDEFEKHGAYGMNAQTGKELTEYYVDLPRTAFEFWCSIEAARISDPVMRQFYKERDVVMEERRMRFEDDPEGKLYEKLLGSAFHVHPYRNPIIGYEGDIRRLTATIVDNLHKQYYVPGNIVISIVGDVNPDEDIHVVEKYFGKLPTAPVPELPRVVEPDQKGERRVVLRTEAAPSIAIAYKKPTYPHPDDPALSLLSQILAGSDVSPLYTEIVRDKQIASSFGVFEAPGKAYPNLFVFTGTVVSHHTTAEVLQTFDDAIARFKERGPTDEEMEIAKRAVSVGFIGELKSNRSLARMFTDDALLFGKWNASLDWYALVMKTTKEEVQNAAKKYLVQASRTVGTIETKNAHRK